MGIYNTIGSTKPGHVKTGPSISNTVGTAKPTAAVCVTDTCNPNMTLSGVQLPSGYAVSQFFVGGCTTFNQSDDMSPIFITAAHLVRYIEYIERNPLPYRSLTFANVAATAGALTGSPTQFTAPDAEAEYGLGGTLYLFDFPALTSTQASFTYDIAGTDLVIPDRQTAAAQNAQFSQTGRFGAIFALPSFSVKNIRYLAPAALRDINYDRRSSENNVTWAFGNTGNNPFGTSIFPAGANVLARAVGALDPAWPYIRDALLAGNPDLLGAMPANAISGGNSWDGGPGMRRAA